MTEKEFENLEVGDKVWSVTNMWGRESIPYELKVIGIRIDFNSLETIWLDGSHKTNFSWLDCYPTKVKALEAVIERCETHIKDKEDDIAYEKKEVERYKAELAKAKEEENKFKWIANFSSGIVAKTSLIADKDIEGWFKTCDTEREAYEALAKYYLEKYYETRRKVEETK